MINRSRGRTASIATATAMLVSGLAFLLHPSPGQAASTLDVQVAQSPSTQCSTTPPAGYCFVPASPPAVAPGTTVKWTNTTGAPHTVSRCTDPSIAACQGSGSDVSNSPINGNLGARGSSNPPDTYSVTLSSPGTYHYYCQIHTYMHGVITVSGPASPTPTPTPAVFTLPPGSGPPTQTTAPTPTPTPTPSTAPTPSPSDTSSPEAVTSPSPSDSASATAGPALGAAGNGGGGGSPLVAIVLLIIALLAIGGGVLAYRMYRSPQ